jgi:hypothetical protein
MSETDAEIESARIRLNDYVGVLQGAGVQSRALFLHRFEHWHKNRLFKPDQPRMFARHWYTHIGQGWPLGLAADGAYHLFYVVDVGVYAASLRPCPQFGTTGGGNRTTTTTSGPDDMSSFADADENVWIVGQYEYDGVHRAAGTTTGLVGLDRDLFATAETLEDHLAELASEQTRNA